MTAIAPAAALPIADAPAPWGMMAAVDLHGCDRTRLEDPETIRRFVPTVIEAIGMRAHGPLMIFSSKAFDPELAAAIAERHFGGHAKLTVLHR